MGKPSSPRPPVAAPNPAWLISQDSSNEEPSSSQTRSQGSRIKSDLIAAWTSGRHSSSTVPVVCVRFGGAITSGFGAGSEVKCGSRERAASSPLLLSAGVIRVMSFKEANH